MSLDAIGIVCRELKATVTFYGILGVEIKESGGPDHLEGTTASGVRIMLDSADLMKKLNPTWKEPVGTGVILCFKQASPDEVGRLFAHITDAGFDIVKPPWDAFWGQRYASVRDPNGNQVDIFAPL